MYGTTHTIAWLMKYGMIDVRQLKVFASLGTNVISYGAGESSHDRDGNMMGASYLGLLCSSLGLVPVRKCLLQSLEDPGTLLRTGFVEDFLQGGDLTGTEEDARPPQPKHFRRYLQIQQEH